METGDGAYSNPRRHGPCRCADFQIPRLFGAGYTEKRRADGVVNRSLKPRTLSGVHHIAAVIHFLKDLAQDLLKKNE